MEDTSNIVSKPQRERLRQIQHDFKRQWRGKGIKPDWCGRPGTSNIVNRKRHYEVSEGLIDDEENFRFLVKLLIKLKEMELAKKMERERADANAERNANAKKNHMRNEVEDDLDEPYYPPILNNDQFYYFDAIEKFQMLKDAAPTLAYGHSTILPVNNGDNSALLYKVFRGDNKLVRSLLEAN